MHETSLSLCLSQDLISSSIMQKANRLSNSLYNNLYMNYRH